MNTWYNDATVNFQTFRYDSDTAQQLIRDYLPERWSILDDHTLRCFVGMLETGECKMSDFLTVGGDQLVKQIKALQANG